jgi:hypothetical protein
VGQALLQGPHEWLSARQVKSCHGGGGNVTEVMSAARRYRCEVILAIAIALLGLGALSSIYAVGHWTIAPGLFWFRSATWGDGLLLPLAGGLLLGVARSLPPSKGDRLWGAAGALLGAVAGALVLWQWLRDPAPALNWTLPRPHVFNIAGWYHAIFLGAFSSFVTGLYFVVLVRLTRLHHDDPVRFGELVVSLPWVLLWASLITFAGLVAVDSSRSTSDAAMASLYAIAVAAFICFAPILIIAAGCRTLVINAIVLALFIASGPTAWAAKRAPVRADTVVLTIVAIGCALAFAAADPGSSVPGADRWRRLETLAALSIFVSLGVVPTMGSNFSISTAGACLAGAAIALALLKIVITVSRKRMGPALAGRSFRLLLHAMTPPWVMMVLAVTAVWSAQKSNINSNVSSGIVLLSSVVVVNLLSPMLRNTYHDFVLAEEAATGVGEISPEQKRRGRVAAQAVVGISISGICSLLLLTAALAGSYSFQPGRAHNPVPLAVFIGLSIVVILLAVALWWSRQGPIPSRKAVILTALAACIWTAVCVPRIVIHGHDWASFLLVVLLGIWTAESLKSNCGILQRENSGRIQRLICVLVALSVASAMLWATTAGLRWGEQPVNVYWSLLPFTIVTVVSFMLIYVAAVTCFPRSQTARGTNYGPLAGVLQDQGLMTLLALIVIWLPAVVFIHIPGSTKYRYLAIALTLLGFMLLFGSIYNWILRYNSRHAAFRQYLLAPTGKWPDRRRYPLVPWQRARTIDFLEPLIRDEAATTDDREWADALEAHITFQNLLSLVMVIIAVIPLLAFLKEIAYVPTPD